MRYVRLFLLVVLLSLVAGCSQVDEQSVPTSPTIVDLPAVNEKDLAGQPPMALSTATAQVTIRGSWLMSFTVQIWQNGVLRAQNTGVTLPLGYRTISFSGLPSGCGYIANVWANGVGVQSHTWPSKCISGTTHLGCLQFNMAGYPEPWSGSCP